MFEFLSENFPDLGGTIGGLLAFVVLTVVVVLAGRFIAGAFDHPRYDN